METTIQSLNLETKADDVHVCVRDTVCVRCVCVRERERESVRACVCVREPNLRWNPGPSDSSPGWNPGPSDTYTDGGTSINADGFHRTRPSPWEQEADGPERPKGERQGPRIVHSTRANDLLESKLACGHDSFRYYAVVMATGLRRCGYG